MKIHKLVATGILVLVLITCILSAGCTSQQQQADEQITGTWVPDHSRFVQVAQLLLPDLSEKLDVGALPENILSEYISISITFEKDGIAKLVMTIPSENIDKTWDLTWKKTASNTYLVSMNDTQFELILHSDTGILSDKLSILAFTKA